MTQRKKYKLQEEKGECFNESLIEYRSYSAIENVELLPDNIVIPAIEYAQLARENNRMISHANVYKLLVDKLGWR